MKIIATLGAGLLVATGVVAVQPAEAQRGWNDRGPGWDRGGPGWDRGRPGIRGDRGWRGGGRHYRGDRRWRNDWNRAGWRGGRGHYGRPRTVCRWVDVYYGPQQRCFRVR